MAELSPAVLEALASGYQQGVSTIQIAAEQAMVDAWITADVSDPPTDEDRSAWASAAWLVFLPAATAIAGLTWQYLSMTNQYVGIGPPLPQPDVEWARSDFDQWVMSPVTRMTELSATGVSGGEATTELGKHIEKLVSAATRNGEQLSYEQIVNSLEWDLTWEFTDETPDVIVGTVPAGRVEDAANQLNEQGYPTRRRSRSDKRWKRMIQSGACGWCEVVASPIYTDAGSQEGRAAQWHTFCRCSWRMMTPTEVSGYRPPQRAGQWRETIQRRAEVPDSQGNE